MPCSEPGPANVPVADQCTATWSPSPTMSSTSKRRSGELPKNSAHQARTPSGPWASGWPAMWQTPSGAHAAAIASRSCRVSASKYAVITAFGVVS